VHEPEPEAAPVPQQATRRLLYISRRAPHGSIYAQEALEVVLIGAAFEQEVSIAFMDDGVYQLKRGQRPGVLGMKDYSRTFRALEDFDIQALLVERESLEARALSPEDLLVPVTVVGSARLGEIIESHDVVLGL